MKRRSSTGLSAKSQSISRVASFLSEGGESTHETTPDKSDGVGNDKNEFGVVVAVRVAPLALREKMKAGKNSVVRQQEEEEPVVDVEADGKTIVLLDPVKRGVSRSTFTFEHVFSAIAPSVDVDVISNGNTNISQEHLEVEMKNAKMLMSSPESSTNVECHTGINVPGNDEEAAELEQQKIFEALGVPLVDSSLRGFNACIFAYGQSGSGKTYTMMGSEKHKGIIPRLCHLLLSRLSGQMRNDDSIVTSSLCSPIAESYKGCASSQASTSPLAERSPKVTISFMEIYNERVLDLLKPARGKGSTGNSCNNRSDSDPTAGYKSLKVRKNPQHGPFVEGLTTISVSDWEECHRYIMRGNAARSQASTAMNDTSSRSHTIFQMIVTQTVSLGGRVRGRGVTTERVSKINLVDLAGSERSSQIESTRNERQLSETNAINLSLSVLRRVIDALVSKSKIVPYRESLLTYVLSDNFGGNSRTVMCGTISPQISSFSETEATLRYASLARGIINRVKVNEHPYVKIVRELRERIKSMQEELGLHKALSAQNSVLEAKSTTKSSCAPDELLQREQELSENLQKSKSREKELLGNLQKIQEDEKKWKKEAHRQKKEKEKLMTTLKDLVQKKPELVAEGVIRIPTCENEEEASMSSSATSCATPTNRKGNETKVSVTKPDRAASVLSSHSRIVSAQNSTTKPPEDSPKHAMNKSARGETPINSGVNPKIRNVGVIIPNGGDDYGGQSDIRSLHPSDSMRNQPLSHLSSPLDRAQTFEDSTALMPPRHYPHSMSLRLMHSGASLFSGQYAVPQLPPLNPHPFSQGVMGYGRESFRNRLADAVISLQPTLPPRGSSSMNSFRKPSNGCVPSSYGQIESGNPANVHLNAFTPSPLQVHNRITEGLSMPPSILAKRTISSNGITTRKV